VILPNDNDPNAPPFPDIYWNAAASYYAYVFAKLSIQGIDVLGESQLVGYPQLGSLAPQYPSVALLNLQTGQGTARYWVLKMLVRHMQIGDHMMKTQPTPTMPSFCAQALGESNVTLSCVDPTARIQPIEFASYGRPMGSCGDFSIGTCHAPKSLQVVQQLCVGKQSCTVWVDPATFGVDPCPNYLKHIHIQARCSNGVGVAPWDSQLYYAQGFAAPDGTNRRLLLISKTINPLRVNVPQATGAKLVWIDQSTGYGPPAVETAASDTIALEPFSVMFVFFS